MRILLFILFAFALHACEVKVSKGDNKDEKEEKKSYTRNNKKIRNGIDFETTGGLKVEQAFLTYVDDGSFVSDENITELKRALKLNLVIDGWKAEDGQVYLGAEEKVSAEGDVIMTITDLFEQNNINSVPEKDARFITLDIVINKINRLADYFLVEFRVWNKRQDQEVTGSYKFYINEM